MTKQQQGFTMVELVMVIVILGILAAVALPRIYDLQINARVAKAQAMYGAVRSASAIAHSAALVINQTGATGTVALEGASITLANGYPAAASIATAANINDTNDSVTTSTGADGVVPTETTIQVNGATRPASCQVSYKSPAALGGAPTISVVTAGC